MRVDWQRIERTWFQAAADAIVATVEANPTERFYAGAFWLLYGDYTVIRPSVFGLNAEDSDPDIRWHPPDWRWAMIDAAHERVDPLYEPLTHLDGDEAAFEALWERHIDALAAVSRRLTAFVRSGQIAAPRAAFTPGFFVGIVDFSQGDEAIDYLKRSVDEETIAASGILDDL